MMTENTSESTAVAEEVTTAPGNSYDDFPYPSHPFPQTHPDRLSTVARLFGVEPTQTEACRVLEIGCASGGNLIPMADQMPHARFEGVDLSGVQIEEAQQRIQALGLKNVEVRHADVSAPDQSFGEYDFIICHGVYSWIPSHVQDAILAVCQNHLAANGVAFISYNTYPGWHFRGMIRDMMCFHDNQSRDPKERVGQARALLAFLAESVSSESSAYSMLLKSELELLKQHNDGYLFHEHLEANNHPCYFHEFMSRAGEHELQYLGDTSLSSMWIGNFPQTVQETLQRIAPDIIQREQYTDFVRNRLFRQTLLCHGNVSVDRNLGADRIENARFSGRFTIEGDQNNVDLSPSASVTFAAPGAGRKLTTSDPLVKAALAHVANNWPASMEFQDIFQTARLSLGTNRIEDANRVETSRNNLATQLIRLHVSGLLEVKFDPDRFVSTVSERPATSQAAREQASRDNRVTNQRHELVNIDDFVRNLFPAIDGTRNREELLEYARGLVDGGKLVIQSAPDTPDEKLNELLNQAVDQALLKMAKQALLQQ